MHLIYSTNKSISIEGGAWLKGENMSNYISPLYETRPEIYNRENKVKSSFITRAKGRLSGLVAFFFLISFIVGVIVGVKTILNWIF